MKEVAQLLKPLRPRAFIPKRAYLAATTQLPLVPARIIKKSGAVSLQTYEAHLYHKKKLFQNSENFWGEKLAISKKGMIIQGDSLLARESIGPIQERREKILRGEETQPLSTLIELDKGKIPDLLYALPQDIWESFVTELPDKEVARLLNLTKHRHLWRAYNYAEELIMPKVNKFGKISKTAMDTYIGELPSSQKDPAAFEKFVHDSKRACSSYRGFTAEVRACLFYHKRNDMEKMIRINKDDCNLIKDYILALTKDFFLSYYARLPTAKGLQDKRETQLRLKELESLCGRIIAEATKEDTLMRLQERWHRNVSQIESRKPKPLFERQWHSLFQEQCIDGTTFKCLTTHDELQMEGREMEHCVGGYVSDCMSASSHIIRVQSDTGERATLEIFFEKNKAVIKQNFGPKNKQPSTKMKEVCEHLLLKINSGEITLNPDRGSTTKIISLHHVASIYPYQLDDHAAQERIYEAYKFFQVLPSIMVAPSYEAMLQKIGIEEAIAVERALDSYSINFVY